MNETHMDVGTVIRKPDVTHQIIAYMSAEQLREPIDTDEGRAVTRRDVIEAELAAEGLLLLVSPNGYLSQEAQHYNTVLHRQHLEQGRIATIGSLGDRMLHAIVAVGPPQAA